MGMANERRSYLVSPLIGWAYAQNDPCVLCFISLKPELHDHHIADIFKIIFLKEKFVHLIPILVNFVPNGPLEIQWAMSLGNGLIQNRGEVITSPMMQSSLTHYIGLLIEAKTK